MTDQLVPIREYSRAETEAEIAQLSKEIAERRALLEKENNIEATPAEAAHEVLVDKIRAELGEKAPEIFRRNPTGEGSFVDDLSDVHKTRLNELVETTFTKGPRVAIRELFDVDPILIEAYAKVLSEQLHDEMKARGFLN